jgi:hypothetical protein
MKRSILTSFAAEVRVLRTFAIRSSVDIMIGLDWDVTKTTPEQCLAVESNAPCQVCDDAGVVVTPPMASFEMFGNLGCFAGAGDDSADAVAVLD